CKTAPGKSLKSSQKTHLWLHKVLIFPNRSTRTKFEHPLTQHRKGMALPILSGRAAKPPSGTSPPAPHRGTKFLRKRITSSPPVASAPHSTTPESAFARRSHPR